MDIDKIVRFKLDYYMDSVSNRYETELLVYYSNYPSSVYIECKMEKSLSPPKRDFTILIEDNGYEPRIRLLK